MSDFGSPQYWLAPLNLADVPRTGLGAHSPVQQDNRERMIRPAAEPVLGVQSLCFNGSCKTVLQMGDLQGASTQRLE